MSKCEQCIVREFSSLKALSKDELLKMSDCKVTYTIKKGEAIFEEGEVTNGIYCISEGICKLSKLSANGKDQIVKLVKSGELLGQRSMISDEPANLSAIALEDMQVCFIPKSKVMQAIKENPAFSLQLMKNISHQLNQANASISMMAQKSVKERLADILLQLQTTFGVDSDGFVDCFGMLKSFGSLEIGDSRLGWVYE